MLQVEPCRQYTLVIEWSAAEWRKQLAAIACDQDTELTCVLVHLERQTWSCDRVRATITAPIDPVNRGALRRALALWGCETVELDFLEDIELVPRRRYRTPSGLFQVA